MLKNLLLSLNNPNAFLLLCLVLIVFIIPILPVPYHDITYQLLFSVVFILSALSLQQIQNKIVIGSVLLLILVIWISFLSGLPGLLLLARIGQGLFFIFITARLIRQTATAQHVNLRVIADSISGYLLVGIIYSLVVYSIVRVQPGAFHFPDGESGIVPDAASKMFYYTFVTYTSTGYGDITPVSPGVRSLATLISASGQLYIAIIIALLVGKFSSTSTKN